MIVGVWNSADGWRWTLRARNGRTIGASSESYRRRPDCIRNFHQVTGRRVPLVPRRLCDFWRHL